MRFLPRSPKPVEPPDAGRVARSDLPPTVQHVLGAKGRSRSKSRKREPPEVYVPTGSPPRLLDNALNQTPILPPLHPTEPLSLKGDYDFNWPDPWRSDSPTANGGIPPFPSMSAQRKALPRATSSNDLRSRSQPHAPAYAARQPQRGPPNMANSSPVQPHQFYPESPPSIESLETQTRDYYDPSKQPLYVSQQTSASAVRDHGLRKGLPMISIHGTASEPTLVKPQPQRPLKSAMKKAPQEGCRKRDGERKGKKLDIGSLFAAQHKYPSAGNHSPSAHARAEYNFDFFPENTVRVKLQRLTPHARFEAQKSAGGLSNNSDSTVREKVFERDVYDTAKVNVRRPPKGIQNWFDGFDVSSDEEEKTYMREMARANRPGPPVELQARGQLRTNEPVPSNFSPYEEVASTAPRQSPPRSPHARKASVDPVEDNLLAIQHAKEMMKRRAQAHRPPTPDSSPASITRSARAAKPPQRDGESRLAHSRLASQSVLSLSSGSGGDEVTTQDPPSRRDSMGEGSVVLGSAAFVGIHRPDMPPRQLRTSSSAHSHHQENTLRRSISTGKTSGTIPMRLGSDVIPVPPIPADRSTLGSSRTADSTAHALRRLNGLRDSTSQASRSRRTTRSALDDSRSMASQSITAETTSSATDGSRFMQVSEEEMILLELMRQKRAAMQKNSFSEGYRLALRQEHLAKRRDGVHKNALQILKAKEDLSHRQSLTSTVFSEDHENPTVAAMRRKYSVLHKEDVDKTLKLERFLSLDPHGQVQAVPGADRFPEPPLVVDREEGDPDEEEGEEELEEPPVLLQAKTYSPIQKLPEKGRVRDSVSRSRSHQTLSASHTLSPALSRSTTQSPHDALSDDYLEDHHDRVRAFLASSSASEAQDLFPTPPNHSRASMMSPQDEWRKRGSMLLSRAPVPEEEPVVDDDNDYEESIRNRDSRYPEPLQPRPHRHEPPMKGRLRPTTSDRKNQYRLSYTPEADPLLETIGGLAVPTSSNSSSSGDKLRDLHPDIHPTLDAGPLELPTVGFSAPNALPGSPSLSSRPSTMTPEFPAVPSHSDKTDLVSDNASYREREPGRASTPDTELSVPGTNAAPASAAKKPAVRRPPAIDALATKRGIDRTSTGMSSITSAGEDVLAAWAELGGGSSDFAFRKIGTGRR